MKMIKLKCKQPGLIFQNNGAVPYTIRFLDAPVSVTEAVAVHLQEKFPDLFEKVGEEEGVKELDIDKMTKDELLDYTAIHGIEADYKEKVSEIRDKVRKYLEERK